MVYFIGATIVATIGLQLYWNIQNYNTNKQRLISEVQLGLDNSIESYFADLARTEVITLIDSSVDTIIHSAKRFSISDSISRDSVFLKVVSDSHTVVKNIHNFSRIIDSVAGRKHFGADSRSTISMFQRKAVLDSFNHLEGLANKIIISISNDSLDFNRLDTLLTREFNRKNISINYELRHSKNDSVLNTFRNAQGQQLVLSTFSKSTYLPSDEKLELLFTNPTLIVLKKGLTGIILSLLLSASIIACLLYLLRTISKQKQLAEIKNDLISNITHEFKTPIATVATAIEGIKNFNQENDKAKTNTYLDISDNQLQKLNLMVEKLLETATLDSDKLLLQKESTDLVPMLKKIVEKFQLLCPEKSIDFKSNVTTLIKELDPFHLENALGNLIDNAIKYGGPLIELNLNALIDTVEISVSDNGNGLDKNQREKIFDKFYRVPTGNRHDIKGFGIGLFYAKKIIEKHGGNLSLLPGTKLNVFRITL